MAAFLWGDPDPDQWSKICLDHGASKEPVNLWPEWICRFLWCTMIQTHLESLIQIWITPDGKGTQPIGISCWCSSSLIAVSDTSKEIHNFIIHVWQGKSERSDWFLDFTGKGHKLCIFCFRKLANSKQGMARVPYNKLLTNLASSSCTGKYWPSFIFVRTSLCSVRTAKTSVQLIPQSPVCFYCLYRPSDMVRKKLENHVEIFSNINNTEESGD